MVAALYVEKDGAYYGLPHVDPWDAERDARSYAGPHPVVAHPPCGVDLPSLKWGRAEGDFERGITNAPAVISRRKDCWGTPAEFRDLLVGIARQACLKSASGTLNTNGESTK